MYEIGERKGCSAPTIAAIIILLVVGYLFANFLMFPSGNSRSRIYSSSAAVAPSASQPVYHDVVYKVTTQRKNSVYPCFEFSTTYEMKHGTSQKKAYICDGNKDVEVDRRTALSGDFVYLSVQNDRYLAKISCQVHINGKLVMETFSEGQYVIASCSGSVP